MFDKVKKKVSIKLDTRAWGSGASLSQMSQLTNQIIKSTPT